MIFVDVPQNTPEWFRARLGKATASCFDKIITPKTMKMSSQADYYADQLIAELITGESEEKFPSTYDMERGALLEPDAAKLYEFETGYKLLHGGFIINDEGTSGCSPDCRVFDLSGTLIGGVEIKCPKGGTHVGNLLREAIDPEYKAQTQGQILTAGFQFVDWFSYHPDMPPSRITVEKDDEFCAALEERLIEFEGMIQRKIAILLDRGVTIPDRQSYMPKPQTAKATFNTDTFMAG